MANRRERVNAALALLLMATAVIACSSLKNLGKSPYAEVTKLLSEAAEDLDETEKIKKQSQDKQSELNKAMTEKRIDDVKRILADLIGDIDKGLEKGKDAVDKIDKASKQDVKTQCKDYLSIKAQAFQKVVKYWETVREAAIIVRDNFTAKGLPDDKRTEYMNKANESKKLTDEALELDRKAADISRANPGVCKE